MPYVDLEGNDLSTAVSLSFGQSHQGQLTNRDVDTFRLTTNSAGVITINFQHPNGIGTSGERLNVQLLDENSNVIIWNDDIRGNTTLTATVDAAGDYYIKVIDYYSSGAEVVGDYQLSATFQTLPNVVYDGALNNDLSTAVDATNADSICGVLTNNDDDVFKITTTQGGLIALDFVHPSGIGIDGERLVVEFVDEDNNVIVRNDDIYGNTQLAASVSVAGDYYVRISDYYSSGNDIIGEYHLTPRFQALPNVVYDGATNNDLSTAVDITGADAAYGVLINHDMDVFKITTTQGGLITLDFVHPSGIGVDGERLIVELVDENSNVIVRNDDIYGNTQIAATVSVAGNYYVRISDYYSSGNDIIGEYHLTSSFQALPNVVYDGATNNDTSRAIDATGASAIHGTLTAYDVDVFRVSLDEPGEILVNFQHPDGLGTSGTGLTVQILDGQGNILSEQYVRGSASLTAMAADVGNYYIRVSSRTSTTDIIGNYVITMELPGIDPEASVLQGTAGNDSITGTEDDNIIYGYVGDDLLIGGSGDDQLIGGPGVDILIGGEGNDVFLFESLADLGNSLRTIDTISDFQNGEQIDLHLLDANTVTPEDDAFVLGEGRFTAPGQLRYHSGLQVLYGNVDSDLRTIDFGIRVTGISDISIADIVL